MKQKLIFFFLMIFAIPLFAQNYIAFFNDSPEGDAYYDASWGYATAPSYLELARNNDKFPIDSKHPLQGRHSLRLHWTSMSGGDWAIAVAAVGWYGFDFTQYDSIQFWINAPQSIARTDLPDLAVEDLSNHKSTSVWLGDYFMGVDDDSITWQKVAIPISALQPGTENADFTKIKTIFHFQKNADGVEHIAWIDNIFVIKSGSFNLTPPDLPANLIATGHDSRIDLTWKPNLETDLLGYYIYRRSSGQADFARIKMSVHDVPVFSDFLGTNNQTNSYYVTAVNRALLESEPSDTVNATSRPMTDEELLTSVQEATFRYFYDFGHPVSGLARERNSSGDVCASGGTGMGLITIMVGAERGFVSRDSASARILKIIRFLQDKAIRYHGAWAHWIHGATGATIPFSQYDDGADLVETSYVVQGLLTVRQYFDQNNFVENEIRSRATQLWEEVEWDWYRRFTGSYVLYWHWSPNYSWRMDLKIRGFNETMIVYLLAIASPTHPVPKELYYNGWAGQSYVNGSTYYGYKQWVGEPLGGPLFFTHYSFLGFDPRDKADRFCNYFENNRNITLINRAYCIQNPKKFPGYGELVWGLTASDNPSGYGAHSPLNDNGTITPTAAISAMPYTPQESIATMKNFYHTYGNKLWGEFGFQDAFNLSQNWFASSYLAIDQGTIAPMIENYRTGLCWDMFMKNPEIQPMLDAIGWMTTKVSEGSDSSPRQFRVSQNYPNPFNGETLIRFTLPEALPVTMEIYNLLGEKVVTIYLNEKLLAGNHQVKFDGKNLSSGIYLFKIQAGRFNEMKKMLLTK